MSSARQALARLTRGALTAGVAGLLNACALVHPPPPPSSEDAEVSSCTAYEVAVAFARRRYAVGDDTRVVVLDEVNSQLGCALAGNPQACEATQQARPPATVSLRECRFRPGLRVWLWAPRELREAQKRLGCEGAAWCLQGSSSPVFPQVLTLGAISDDGEGHALVDVTVGSDAVQLGLRPHAREGWTVESAVSLEPEKNAPQGSR